MRNADRKGYEAQVSAQLQGWTAQAAGDGAARGEGHPRIVRHRMREGARKWMGPFLGAVSMRLRRKRSYFAFCRTSPPASGAPASARLQVYHVPPHKAPPSSQYVLLHEVSPWSQQRRPELIEPKPRRDDRDPAVSYGTTNRNQESDSSEADAVSGASELAQSARGPH